MPDYNSSYTGAQIDANLAKAATAVQPAGLATVATTGAYNDLTGKPTLGTAAATASTAYATAAQGTLASTAVQPTNNATVLGSGSATNGQVLAANGSGGTTWATASGGGGTPGGATTQVQFNDGGAFGGGSGLTFDKTTNALTISGGSMVMSGSMSAPAWTTNGIRYRGVPSTLTDTTSSGTVAAAYTNAHGGNTIAASAATTFTNYFTTFISPPTSGTNVTFSNRWALGLGGSMSIATGAVTTSSPVIDMAQTWNNAAVTFTGIKANVTDTASAAASLLMDLQVGGVSQFSVSRAGVLTIGTASGGEIKSGMSGPLVQQVSNSWDFCNTNKSFPAIRVTAGTGVAIASDLYFGFNSATYFTSGSIDTRLYRDAANTFAQRNGTAAQTVNLYGTYTDASNYRRLTKTMSTAGVAVIKPEGAGTGASGNVLHISGLPTANPGPGILWNNAGTPAIGT